MLITIVTMHRKKVGLKVKFIIITMVWWKSNNIETIPLKQNYIQNNSYNVLKQEQLFKTENYDYNYGKYQTK